MPFLANWGGSIGGQQRWGIHPGTSGGWYQAIHDAYALTPDGPAGPGTYPMFFINKTTDGGATWTDVTGLMAFPVIDNEPGGSGDFNNVGCAFYNGIFYILAFQPRNLPPDKPKYSLVLRFDTATDTWLTALPDIGFIPTSDPFGDFDTAFWYSIAVNPTNGHIVFIAAGPTETISGKHCTRVVFFEYDGVSWTGPTTIPGQAGVGRHFFAQDMFFSSTGRCHIFLESALALVPPYFTSHYLHEITISAGGSFGTLQTISTDVASDAPEAREGDVGLGIAYIDHSSIEQIAIPFIGNTGTTPPNSEGRPMANWIATAVDADTPTWATTEVDTTTQIGGSIAATESLVNLMAHAGDLYMGWCAATQWQNDDPSASNVYYSKNDGTGWSGLVALVSYPYTVIATGLNMAFVNGDVAVVVFRQDGLGGSFDGPPATTNTIRHESFFPAPTATLTLQKVVLNTHGGTAGPTDWTVRAIGPATLSGAGSASSPGLPAGTYALSEGGPPGYSASAWVCVGGSQSGSNITLAGGDVVTCTITNSDVAPPPPPPPSMCEPVTVTTPAPSLAAYNEATEKQGS